MIDADTSPYVVTHGSGSGSRCWDLLVPERDRLALAVDLCARGRRPAPLLEVTIAGLVVVPD